MSLKNKINKIEKKKNLIVENKDLNVKKSFRLRGKNLFLTYSSLESNITKEIILENIFKNDILKDKLLWGILGFEKHKTGENHAHIVIVLKKSIDTKKIENFNCICNKRGNYQSVRGLKSVVQYVIKENWEFFGDIDSVSNSEIISILMRAEIENQNKEVIDLVDGGPKRKEYLYKHSSQLIRYEKLVKMREFNRLMEEKPGIMSLNYKNVKDNYSKEVLEVFDYINDNLHAKQRHLKKKNLHIWSRDPSLGKTTFINCLKEKAASYVYPDDNWFETYKNDIYQFIIWDEFTVIGKDISFLKRFLDGQNMRLPMKGSHTMKLDNPLVILLSNAPLRDSVLKKYSSTCNCNPSRLKEDVLCESAHCNVSDYAKNVYKVLMSRVKEIEINKPGFLFLPCYRSSISALKQIIKVKK